MSKKSDYNAIGQFIVSIKTTIRDLANLKLNISEMHYEGLSVLNDREFAAKYLVALPDKKELEQFIKTEIKEN